MRAELRTLRILVGLPVLLLFTAAWTLVALMPTGQKVIDSGLPIVVASFVGMLVMRIARIVEAGVWRLLPQGQRAVMRATAFIVLMVSLLLGTIWMRAAPNFAGQVPLLPVLALYIHFSLLTLPLVLQTGQHVKRWMVVAYILACLFLFMLSIASSLREVAWVWYCASALSAALWLAGSFGKLPLGFVSRMLRRVTDLERLMAPPFANLNPRFATRIAPADAVLRARWSTVYLGLPVAALVLVGWAAYEHFFMSTSGFPDRRSRAFGSESWMLSAVMLVLTQRYTAPARSLWLRWGDSRAQIFRLVERAVAIDALLLGGLAWLTVTLFAMQRGLAPTPGFALKTFAGCVVVCFVPAYLGLIWSTLHDWRQRMVAIAAIAVTLGYLWSQWLFTLGIRNWHSFSLDSNRLVMLLLVVVAVRAVAAWRWRTIDWIHLRTIGRKK